MFPQNKPAVLKVFRENPFTVSRVPDQKRSSFLYGEGESSPYAENWKRCLFHQKIFHISNFTGVTV
jgi:hypothetical protein